MRAKAKAVTAKQLKQSASELALFGRVTKLEAIVEALKANAQAQLKAERPEGHDDLTARVARLELASMFGIEKKAKPEDYVLTDADWQRVIDEGYLCEFGDYYGYGDWTPGRLVRADKSGSAYWSQDCSDPWEHCRLLSQPGVMQPYFGQGMPVNGGTKVIAKYRDGRYSLGSAGAIAWNHLGQFRDIMAFMALN